ncbi:hypothetical protein LTR95_018088 [Oleoguttula sp. CCFEE 5521]
MAAVSSNINTQAEDRKPHVDPQPGSKLCSIPHELLLKIFDHLIDHGQALNPSIIAYEDTEEITAAHDAAYVRFYKTPRLAQTCRFLRDLGLKRFIERMLVIVDDDSWLNNQCECNKHPYRALCRHELKHARRSAAVAVLRLAHLRQETEGSYLGR